MVSTGSTDSTTPADSLGSSEEPRFTRRDRTAERRRSILDAALDCYAEGGTEAVTIEALRARSNASTGSIYHHFGNKHGVVAALYQTILGDYRQGLSRDLAQAETARDFVRRIVLFHVRWAARNPLRARYLHEVRRSPALVPIEADLRRSTGDLLREVGARLHDFVDAGAVARLPRQLYAPLIIGPSQEVLRHVLAGRSRLDLDAVAGEVAEALADAAWRSLEPVE